MKTLLTLLIMITSASISNATDPVAFAATLKDQAAATKAIAEINKQSGPLKNAGIENLHFFTQKVAGKDIILATMDFIYESDLYQPQTRWFDIQDSPKLKAAFTALNQAILPHQRQKDPSKSPWVRTETVCVLRPTNATVAKADSPWYAAVTGLKPEKEAEYRLLHNNVWPGVIQAIGASNINRFDIFLIEFGDNQPHLFYLFQYTGNDMINDMKAQSDSPINQRWWKFTDACQQPLHAAPKGSPWLDLDKL